MENFNTNALRRRFYMRLGKYRYRNVKPYERTVRQKHSGQVIFYPFELTASSLRNINASSKLVIKKDFAVLDSISDSTPSDLISLEYMKKCEASFDDFTTTIDSDLAKEGKVISDKNLLSQVKYFLINNKFKLLNKGQFMMTNDDTYFVTFKLLAYHSDIVVDRELIHTLKQDSHELVKQRILSAPDGVFVKAKDSGADLYAVVEIKATVNITHLGLDDKFNPSYM